MSDAITEDLRILQIEPTLPPWDRGTESWWLVTARARHVSARIKVWMSARDAIRLPSNAEGWIRGEVRNALAGVPPVELDGCSPLRLTAAGLPPAEAWSDALALADD